MTEIDRIIHSFCGDKELLAIYPEIGRVKSWALKHSKFLLADSSMIGRLIIVLYFPHFRMNVWTDTSISTEADVLQKRNSSNDAIERARLYRTYNEIDIRSGKDYVKLFHPKILQRMKASDFIDFIKGG